MRLAHVSINAQTIRKNAINGTDDAPIRIAKSKSDAKPIYAREITINGPSRLVYTPSDPIMRCGARLVLMTPYDNVQVIR